MGNLAVGLAAVDVYSKNPKRASLTLRNESTAGQIIRFWLHNSGGLTMTNGDYVLRPTEEKTFIFLEDGEDMRNEVSAIADAANAVLVRAETSYKK